MKNIRLDEKNLSYIIISAYNSKLSELDNKIQQSRLEDELYHRDYTLFKGNQSKVNNFFLGYKQPKDNNIVEHNTDMKYDAIELLDVFKQEKCIIKYWNESYAKEFLYDGIEKPLCVIPYTGEETDYNMIIEDVGFSFSPKKMYKLVESKSDLLKYSIVEIQNNQGEWIEKKIIDLDVEYERLYKVMLKYKKVRVAL